MTCWTLNLNVRLARAAVFVAVGLITLPHAGSAQDICAGGTETCGETSALAEDLMRRRLDRTLGANPADDRLGRLNAPGTSAVVPFAMTPDGNNTNFGTSLTQWSSSLSAADAKRLKDAQAASGDTSPLPEPVRPGPRKFDVWAQGQRQTFDQTGNIEQGSALSTFVGADYRVDRNLLVGGMVQLDESHQTVLGAQDTANGTAYMAGPYLAYRLTPHIVFDAQTAWGTADDSAIAGGESVDYATERALSEAKLSGTWGWQGWQLSQSGAITYLDETSTGIPGAPGTSVDVTRFSVGPEVKRHFAVGDDKSIEPFAFFKSSVDLDDAGLADPNALNTIGGGVSLLKPESFNVRATADYSESTGSDDAGEAKGKVSVTVPTSVLGF